MRQTGLGEATVRTVYCTVPVVIDGSRVYPNLTDDGEPPMGYDMWVCSDSEIEGGYWAVANDDDLTAAWNLVSRAFEEVDRE